MPILEGKSFEPIGSLLSRQRVKVIELPQDEQVWEVPLPIIQEPEPEPEPHEPQMVYGRGMLEGHKRQWDIAVMCFWNEDRTLFEPQ